MSVEASTTFTVMDPGTIPEIFEGGKGPDQGGCYLYGRHYNPTVYNLGRQIAALEGSEAAYCTSSGMGAIAAAILQVCNTGDHIVASTSIYGGTYALLHDFLPAKAGIDTTLVDINDVDAVTAAVSSRTRMIFAESFANPTLRVADIPALARIAHDHDAKLIIDNTFSPLLMAPLDWGADIVVHSITKFISGASDIIAGAVCAEEHFIQGPGAHVRLQGSLRNPVGAVDERRVSRHRARQVRAAAAIQGGLRRCRESETIPRWP